MTQNRARHFGVKFQQMEDTEEFAPEYTTAERVRMAALGILAGSVLIFAGKTWISPWYESFVKTAHCHHVLGHSGVDILFYGIFVGLPIFVILGTSSLVIQGYRILRDKQAPPKGMKVLQKTRIVRGNKARVRGIALAVILPVLLIGFIVWGYIQADALIKSIDMKKIDYAACKSNSSLHTVP